MNITFYTPLNLQQTGGVEVHISSLTQELIKLGHNVRIINTLNDAFDIENIDILHSHGDKLPQIQLRSRAKHWVHTLHGTSVGRAFACKEWFGISAYIAASKEAYAWHNADGVILVSEGVEQEAKKYFRNRSNAHHTVIGNGATLSTNTSNTVGTRNEKINELIKDNTPYVLFLGRGDDHVKNTEGITNSLRTIHSSGLKIKLMAAPGTGFENISQEFVIKLGPVYGEAKDALIKNSACLMLPSFYEADPLVAWEIMAQGRCAVLPNRLKNTAAFNNYPGFIFVNPHNTLEISQGIKNCIKKQPPLPVVRTWATVAKETNNFYLEVTR